MPTKSSQIAKNRQTMFDLGVTLSVAIDKLEKNELSSIAISGTIALFLDHMGYSEIDAMAAASQTTRDYQNLMIRRYYQSAEQKNKFETIWSIVMIAAAIIEKGEIENDIRRIAAQALEDSDGKADSAAPDEKTI